MKPYLTFNETHSVFVFFSYRVSRTFALLGILIIIQQSAEDIVFNNGALVKAHSICFLPIVVGRRRREDPCWAAFAAVAIWEPSAEKAADV